MKVRKAGEKERRHWEKNKEERRDRKQRRRQEGRKIKERGKGNKRKWQDRMKRCSWQSSGSVGLQGQTHPWGWDTGASGVTYLRRGKTSTQAEEEGKKQSVQQWCCEHWGQTRRKEGRRCSEHQSRGSLTGCGGPHQSRYLHCSQWTTQRWDIWLFPEGGAAHRESRLEQTKTVKRKQQQRGAVEDWV